MNWDDQDNKKQRGQIDRMYVSPTEPYEVAYYVDFYLESNKFQLSDENRKKVLKAIEGCTLEPPIQRDVLTAFLDVFFKKN